MLSRFLCVISVISVFTTPAWSESVIKISHYQQQARYKVGNQLLHLALSKLNSPYIIHTPKTQMVNEKEGEDLVIAGALDLQWMSTSEYRETKMIPIKFPIYRGLLGLRLILVTYENHKIMSKVANLKDLQKYTGGHGSHWVDLSVYHANKLRVKTHPDYETLFSLLKNNHFDYFHRGINEIWEEETRYSDTLKVVDNVMLYYPLPVYFFVSKHRPKLAKYIKRGLTKALEDGSYKKLFYESYKEVLAKAKLSQRKLINLKNPNVPINTPSIDAHWWLPVTLKKQ